MAARKVVIMPKTQEYLSKLGEQIKLPNHAGR